MFVSPETAIAVHKPSWQSVGRFLIRQCRSAGRDLRNIPRYIFRTLTGVFAVCGAAGLWAVHGDGPLPCMAPLSGVDPYRISATDCIPSETDPGVRWKGLTPALSILDSVNPTVAAWVRERHRRGHVVFNGERQTTLGSMPALAKYDRLSDRLIIYNELFSENDGMIAVTLCHEYRHSRQNIGKFCLYVMSFLFVEGGELPIMENDALTYEQEAQKAIFGTGRSREQELAAWAKWAQIDSENHRPPHAGSPRLSAVSQANPQP